MLEKERSVFKRSQAKQIKDESTVLRPELFLPTSNIMYIDSFFFCYLPRKSDSIYFVILGYEMTIPS